jgi:outer membrane protein, multidrug efflux system
MQTTYKTIYQTIFAAVFIFVVVSCSSDVKKPTDYELTPIKHTFSQKGGKEVSSKWWKAFNDQTLNNLMDEAFVTNLDLKIAHSRLQQSIAGVDLSDADGGLNLNATARASRTQTQTEGMDDIYSNQFSVEFVASYELDLWGRLDAAAKSAFFNMHSSLYNTSVVAISISSQVAKTYFKLIESKQKKQVLAEQINVAKKYLELLKLKNKLGVVSNLDVLQQEQSITQLETSSLQNNKDYDKIRNDLAKLIGKSPQDFKVNILTKIPDAPAIPAIYPLDTLIKTRPDIRKAFAALQSADQKISSLLANNYPKINLGASITTSATTSADLFKTFINQIFIQISQNILDSGANKARIKQQQAVTKQRLYEYEQTVLNAIYEVENNLILVSAQKNILKNSKQELDNFKNILNISQNRYNNGDLDFQRLLNNITSWQNSQINYLQQKRLYLEYVINIYQAVAKNPFMEEKNEKN